MASYRFLLRQAQPPMREVELEETDDLGAYRTAEKLAAKFDVEVSRAGSFIARIRKRFSARPEDGQ